MKLVLAFSLLSALTQAEGAMPTIEVRASTANVSVGERFQVTLEARGPSGLTYDFPKQISDGAVELILSRPASLAYVAVYQAQVFAIGKDARVPEIEVPYRGKDGGAGVAKSLPLTLNVVSTLDPKDASPAPADFAPPVPVLVSRAFWIASGMAGLLLLTGLGLLVRRLKFPKPLVDPQLTPSVSPEEEALNALNAIAGSQAAKDPRAFYIQLIQVLKQYLERRLEAPVLEMTSTETLALVKAHVWTSPHAAPLRELVTSADLVKFGGSSDVTNSDRQIQLVKDLIGRIDRLRRAELELRSRELGPRKTT